MSGNDWLILLDKFLTWKSLRDDYLDRRTLMQKMECHQSWAIKIQKIDFPLEKYPIPDYKTLSRKHKRENGKQ